MNTKSQKLIGLLGGTSWPSTTIYYENINKLINTNLGNFHSARILLYSIDYNEIKNNYGNNWKRVELLLKDELNFLISKNPDCIILCNNLLHKALDNIEINIDIPIFHAGKLASNYAVSCKYNNILLLGTKITMEDGFFAKYFEDNNIKITIPDKKDRLFIQKLQTQISSGIKNEGFYQDFSLIIEKYNSVDAICLACTELPLYINNNNCKLSIVNPIELQCKEAVNFITNKFNGSL